MQWPASTQIDHEMDRDDIRDDLLLGPCRWLAALCADAALDDAWTDGDAVESWESACLLWHSVRDKYLRTAAGTGWGLTILYTRKDIN